jgi:hypothetical protein
MRVSFLCLSLILACLTTAATPGPGQDKEWVGWLEKVRICPENLVIHAKLDTGARNSSLNAPHANIFKRKGETWVRFDVTDRAGKTATLERKVQRITKIKQHDRPPDLRPVVRLSICLGDTFKVVEVNLRDRSDFNYQMLIGRSFLKEDFVVDASATFTKRPKCRGVKIP